MIKVNLIYPIHPSFLFFNFEYESNESNSNRLTSNVLKKKSPLKTFGIKMLYFFSPFSKNSSPVIS